jgi:hypothetical protein
LTQYEIATLWLEIGLAINVQVMSFATMFFAFVAATYFVGDKLPTWAVLILTFIYTVIAFLIFQGVVSYNISFDHLRAEFSQIPANEVGPYLAGVIGFGEGPGAIRYVFYSTIFGGSYIGSLLFLIHRIRRKTSASET